VPGTNTGCTNTNFMDTNFMDTGGMDTGGMDTGCIDDTCMDEIGMIGQQDAWSRQPVNSVTPAWFNLGGRR